jgi:murein DD-endopeptidase MepM/ murein hydrolase activator NlpD
MFGRKYFLDHDLLYKRIRLTCKQKTLRLFLFLTICAILSWSFNLINNNLKKSIKEIVLTEQIENLKLNYNLLDKEFKNSINILENLQYTDKTYRTILNMDTIEETFLNPGYGGIKKYEELEGYDNSKMMIYSKDQLELIKNKSIVQYESFKSITYQANEWTRELEYLPIISPVNIIIRKGDGIKFRDKHPVLGTPAWHHGQDFSAPYGTEVYATGAGKVKFVGRDKGLGNFIIIEHGYGYESVYGHLSQFKVEQGKYVKRGDLIGLTGSTGYSTGPHLHYQIHLYGKYQNPLYFFNDDLTEDEYIQMIATFNSKFKLR